MARFKKLMMTCNSKLKFRNTVGLAIILRKVVQNKHYTMIRYNCPMTLAGVGPSPTHHEKWEQTPSSVKHGVLGDQ